MINRRAMKPTTPKTIFLLAIFFLSSYPLLAVPPLIGFLINNGEKTTNNPEITIRLRSLKTAPNLLDAMQVGLTDDLSDAEWQPFSSEPLLLQLSGGDGEKTVYARLRDKAGNVSPVEMAKIILDTTPPVGMEFFINKDAPYTNDKTGRVFLQFKGDDAVAWQVSNSPNFDRAAWESLNNHKSWTLDLRTGDGEKQVYARFKDEAGNVGETITKSIILDTEPPKNGQITINDGAKFTKSVKVKLSVKVEGASIVRITDRVDGKNFDYAPGSDGFMTIDWTFDTLQGKKFVKAYFMDAATNKTNAPAEAEIIYDTRGPAAPRLALDNGNKFTNSSEGKVDLQLQLRENEPNLMLAISNTEDLSNATTQAFSATVKGWQLPTEKDGVKNVYARLTDEAGNHSDIASGSIVLDRTPPTVKSFRINDEKEYVIVPRVNIAIEAEDANTMQISNNPNFTPATQWEAYKPTVVDWRIIPAGDGKKTVYGRFRDEAGNISEVHSASVILDTQPPVGKISINNGQKFTNHPEGKVTLNIAYDSDDVVGMQIANTPDFSGVKLTPVTKEVTDWQLEPGDGLKNVFLRLQDKAGNYSNVYNSNIVVDRHPPENADIKINNGEPWVTNPSRRVALSLTATNALKMKVSNSPDFADAEWIPYRTSIGWTLEGPEGEHTVYAIFADQIDNITAPVSAKIKSDFTPPVVGKFAIEGEKKYTNDPQKRVKLVLEVEGATEMSVDNMPISENSTWEPYKAEKAWILSNEDGLKTVYARFRDQAGNVTAEQTARVMLDRVPPTDPEIAINRGDEWMTSKEGKVTLYLKAVGASEMQVSNTADFASAPWEGYSAIKENWPVDLKSREAVVYARFRDEAGNQSGVVSSSIKIDVTPPQNPKIIVNNGDKYLTNRERKMTIGISVDGAKWMRLSTDKNFRDTDWEPAGGIKEMVVLEGDGVKTVYAQFKDQAENVSEIVSDEIILDTTPPKFISFRIDDGAEWTNNTEKKVTLEIRAESATEMRVDHDPAFSNAQWQKYSEKVNGYTLPGDDGEKILFVSFKDEAGNISPAYSAKINLKRSF